MFKRILVGASVLATIIIANTNNVLATEDYRCRDSYPRNEFCAQYHNGKFMNDLKLEQLEDSINHNWRHNSPSNRINADNFSVVWQGKFKFEKGIYEFGVRSDDGIRIYIDGELVYDKWYDQTADRHYFEYRNDRNEYKKVKVEYYENTGAAVAKVDWKLVSEEQNQTTTKDYVRNAYRTFLNREPAQDKLNAWAYDLERGQTTCTYLSRYMITTGEYKSKYITNDMFTMSLSKVFLFRQMDGNELNYWRSVWRTLDPYMPLQQKREIIMQRYIAHNSNEVARKCIEYKIDRI